MTRQFEKKIIFLLVLILILIGITGCAKSIQNCSFNPGVTVQSKTEVKDGEAQKNQSKIEEKLPVKVSPKGEVTCNF